MSIIFDIFIISYWILLIYIPMVCFAGITASVVKENAISVIKNPYFGIIRVSENKGVLIWCIRLIYMGVILCAYGEWYRHDVNPFISL